MEADEVNWSQYFYNIRQVCPWSYKAWQTHKIDIVYWHSQITPLDKYDARLYIAPNYKSRQLKKMSNRLNDLRPHEEWLWSHPEFENNSTPVPTLIQQDRIYLNEIRKKIR